MIEMDVNDGYLNLILDPPMRQMRYSIFVDENQQVMVMLRYIRVLVTS